MNEENAALRHKVQGLQESLMGQELQMSTNQAQKAAAEASAAISHSQAKGEWIKMEAEFKTKLDKFRKFEDENRIVQARHICGVPIATFTRAGRHVITLADLGNGPSQEYAVTLLKAYETCGIKVSR